MTSSSTVARAPSYNPESLCGKVSLVTGASSGIGRAVALALAAQKAAVVSVGRNASELQKTFEAAAEFSDSSTFCRVDLTSGDEIDRLITTVRNRFERIDLLVHSAGEIREGPMREATIGDLDLQYLSNVRSAYALTQAALPMLTANRGQIVFINSSAGLSAKRAHAGQFAATQHALKAIADSLREEVNPDGIRVLTVHPGRTATPRQERLHLQEGKPYFPERLMQPEDVAAMVIAALCLPRSAEVTDISIRPMKKS